MEDEIDGNAVGNKSSHVLKQTFDFGPWTLTSIKSHILQSKCTSADICNVLRQKSIEDSNMKYCTFCRFEKELQLPQLPDMTFANNNLSIKHKDGFGIEFNCLDALKLVESKQDLMKVAVAEIWQQARSECKYAKDVVKPFDWTFTTDYKGTLLSDGKSLKISETSERIDLEKLKVKEKIMFYDDIHLFEDELADNGCAQCSVKVRVMQGSFFILLRYFLRIDHVLIRILDTRIYHECNKNYMLREYTSREGKIPDLQVSSSILTNPNELYQHVPITSSNYEKLEFSV
ncbi:TIP41-like protein isoform X2 [Centruroides vittatus]|uniref:TIP41-like protein isoform X2 n=1 Tax=Centruroides vittatus TaxID=120091 RepID=UPI00350EA787